MTGGVAAASPKTSRHVLTVSDQSLPLSRAIMLETQGIAETFGVKFRVDVERRIEGARKVGAHKTSMLQDLERGRPMEIDPLVTVVQEMGRETNTIGSKAGDVAISRHVVEIKGTLERTRELVQNVE